VKVDIDKGMDRGEDEDEDGVVVVVVEGRKMRSQCCA